VDITDEEFENIIKNLTARQQKLLRVLKESGELDGLVEMMEKIKLEEQEDQEEDSSRPSETKSTEPLSPIELELVQSSGLSPEKVRAILEEN
jgi:hypothetical protein